MRPRSSPTRAEADVIGEVAPRDERGATAKLASSRLVGDAILAGPGYGIKFGFRVGRDGTVRAVHSRFASRASAQFHSQLRKEFSERIEQLLAEEAPSTRLTEASPADSESAARKR